MKDARTGGILLVGHFPPPDAAAVRYVCEDLADLLRAQGWSVITTSSAGGRWRRLAGVISTIVSRRHEYQIAHVDVYSGPAFVVAEIASMLLRILGRSIVLTLHGGALPQFAVRHGNRLRRLCRFSEAVTAPSSYLVERLPPLYPPIRVIPNGLDLTPYEFRQRDGTRRRLVWMRGYNDLYDPGLAVETAALLARNDSGIRLFMAGTAPKEAHRKVIEEEVRNRGLGEQVEVFGPLRKHEVPAHLQRGDIFLNTSRVDNTPVSVLEAMASGSCVVSTDVGGMPYLLTDGHDGRLIHDRGAESFAATIESLFSDPARIRSISDNARSTVERFDWSVVYPLWEALFIAVAAGRSFSFQRH